MTLLKNDSIVATVSIPRIFVNHKSLSRYGNCGCKLVHLAFFNRDLMPELGASRDESANAPETGARAFSE
jgi:hypothetical protein